MSDVFVLDQVDNPHPRMLAEALDLRGKASTGLERERWAGFLQCMVAATGETEGDILAWLDRHARPCDT